MTEALKTGSVSVVTTIIDGYPPFVFFFTSLLLRDEKLKARTIIGSTINMAGVAMVTLF